jgi:hypothetical protein
LYSSVVIQESSEKEMRQVMLTLQSVLKITQNGLCAVLGTEIMRKIAAGDGG